MLNQYTKNNWCGFVTLQIKLDTTLIISRILVHHTSLIWSVSKQHRLFLCILVPNKARMMNQYARNNRPGLLIPQLRLYGYLNTARMVNQSK